MIFLKKSKTWSLQLSSLVLFNTYGSRWFSMCWVLMDFCNDWRNCKFVISTNQTKNLLNFQRKTVSHFLKQTLKRTNLHFKKLFVLVVGVYLNEDILKSFCDIGVAKFHPLIYFFVSVKFSLIKGQFKIVIVLELKNLVFYQLPAQFNSTQLNWVKSDIDYWFIIHHHINFQGTSR